MTDLDVAGATPIATLFEDELIRVSPSATLSQVSTVLLEANVGAVVVGDEATVDGVVSERDIVRAIAEGRDPSATRALEVASTAIVWCDASATVAEVAREMMVEYVRHVLVEADGKVLGIVSARDLLGVYTTDDAEPE